MDGAGSDAPSTKENLGIELGPDALRVVFPDQYFRSLFAQGSRSDGRRLDQSRDVQIQTDVVTSRPASCTARIGNTTVMAAASCHLVRPNDQAPSQGILDISFEMPPGCSSDLRPGRTVEEAQVIASQLERIFGRGVCPVLDMKALCIVDKQHCWKIQYEQIEAVCIDNDGGLLCAAITACVAALSSLKCPKVKIHKSQDIAEDMSGLARAQVELIKDERTPLKLNCFPVPETIGYYRGAADSEVYCLASPTIEEERAAHSNITVVVAAETGDLLFVNGTGSQVLLSPQVLKECIQITKLREQLVKDTIDLAVQPQ